MKVVKIVLGVLGALGIGLVGLILACHFNPGLSDSIAEKLYRKDKAAAVESTAEDADSKVDENGLVKSEDDPSKLLDENGNPISDEQPVMQVSENGEEPQGEVIVTPVELKSLEDYGLTQDDVIDNIPDYFEDCFKQLSKAKGEDTSFYNVVRDSRLAEDVIRSYDDESYREGFMNQFMDDYKIASCGWNVDQEELQAGYFLVTHEYIKGDEAVEQPQE